jgi:DNA-binding transcriptional LysR family regulator
LKEALTMIKQLQRMAVFAQVIESGSFSKAATSLNLGKSVVSAHVAALEKHLATQLINRSTRTLALTQEGVEFYEACRQMLTAGESALAHVESQRAGASGVIRLTSSYNFAVNFLIPQLALFRDKYPEVLIDLVLEDSVSNMIQERFDLALRVGRLHDTGLYATELGKCRMLLCAATDYLKQQPKVTVPEDILQFPWISIDQLPHPERLSLVHTRSGKRATLRLQAAVRTHSGIAAREFVLCGAGVALLPDYAVANDIAAGRVVQLLPTWREEYERPVSAIFPNRDLLPTRVRLLIEFLRQSFALRQRKV